MAHLDVAPPSISAPITSNFFRFFSHPNSREDPSQIIYTPYLYSDRVYFQNSVCIAVLRGVSRRGFFGHFNSTSSASSRHIILYKNTSYCVFIRRISIVYMFDACNDAMPSGHNCMKHIIYSKEIIEGCKLCSIYLGIPCGSLLLCSTVYSGRGGMWSIFERIKNFGHPVLSVEIASVDRDC